MSVDVKQISEQVEKESSVINQIRTEIHKVIVGQEDLIDGLILALLCNNHVLIEGVPGLAKTLSVTTLAGMLQASFQRIQFTPDLLPADVIGTLIYNPKTGDFTTKKGPIFANIILADEINRAPAKVQSALLEAMQERQVTIGDESYGMDDPFLVMATQNPIEQEGTYPLPEAQLDRFMFNILIDYPTEEEECEIMNRTTSGDLPEPDAILNAEEIINLQNLVRRIPIAPNLVNYAMNLSRVTRVRGDGAPEFLRDALSWGAGPRATQYLILGAKARAVIKGRASVEYEDIRAMAHPVLRHRLITTFTAEAEGISTDQIIDQILESVAPNDSKSFSDSKLQNKDVFGS